MPEVIKNNFGYIVGSLVTGLVLFLFVSVMFLSYVNSADQSDWPSWLFFALTLTRKVP